MKSLEVPCPLCGKIKSKVLYKPWRTVEDPTLLFGAASGERGTQQIVRCQTQECGMVYVSPRVSDQIIMEGYRKSSDDGHDSQYESRVTTFFQNLKKHRSLLPPPGSRVLDIGCAGGAFLKAAQRYGYQVVGLEVSKSLAQRCRDRGFQVEEGSLEHTHSKDGFDLICLWDVLEHVTDPRTLLKKCHNLLKQDGILLVNYPDAGTWQAKLSGKNFWWFLSVHLHYFDRHSINKILNLESFTLISRKRHFQRLELGYLIEVMRIYSPVLAKGISSILPRFLKRRVLPYYASQITVLARKSK